MHFDLHQRLRRIKWVFVVVVVFLIIVPKHSKIFTFTRFNRSDTKGFLFLACGSLDPFLMDGDICELCHNRYLLLQYPTL